MDALDFLKAEIARKKTQLEETTASSDHKFIKRSELVSEPSHTSEPASKKQRVSSERDRSSADSHHSHNSTTSSTTTDKLNDEKITMISEDDLKLRFRKLNEPIQLFGETHAQRIQRLKLLESTRQRGHATGQQNVYQDVVEKIDEELKLEILKKGNVKDTKEEKKSERERVFQKYESQFPEIGKDLAEKDKERCMDLIYVFWKRLIFYWEMDLEARSDEEKRSRDGKLESASYAHSVDNMKPFFKLLKQHKLDDDILEKVAEICYFTHRREYVKAEDAYLRFSIGNAAYPLGLTAIGIHERSARDRITTDNVSHVLNDEVRRKWVQTLKRLMTYSQKHFPPETS